MYDLNSYMPVRVISGTGVIEKNKELFALGKKAMLVTGKTSAKKSGAQDDVIKVLDGLGIGAEIYDKIGENPTISVCYEGGKTARETGCGFVIGIGGGSAMDAAKAIAAYAANPEFEPMDIYSAENRRPSLPIVAVPLTAGTGSEVNPYSVMTVNGTAKKSFGSPYSYPKFSFLDPRYFTSLNRKYTVSTALDAFCHCIESYLSPKADEFSMLFAADGAKRIWNVLVNGNITERKPDEDDACGLTLEEREELMTAACEGGIAINRTGTGFPHPLGYNLTLFEDGVPHGMACAIFTGEYISYNSRTEEGKKRLLKFAEAVGTDPDTIARVIPVLSGVKLSLSDETIEKYVSLAENAKNYKNSPYVLNRDEMTEIMRRLFQKK